jgi:hypothetical protein
MRERCLKVKEVVGMHALLDHYGIELKRGRAACPVHKGDNPDAFWITRDDRGYVCSTNGCKGDVINFVKEMNGCEMNDAVEWLDRERTEWHQNPRRMTQERRTGAQRTQGLGSSLSTAERLLMRGCTGIRKATRSSRSGDSEVRRFNSTNVPGAKQVKPYTNGRPGLRDDRRILYNLDRITANSEDFIVLVEGEKCAEAVTEIGFIGTTNPMGSGQWKPEFGYGEVLRDREVLVIHDADEEAEKWVEAIKSDLRGKVKSLQITCVPDEFIEKHPDLKGHDIADLIELEGNDDGAGFIMDSKADAIVMPRGAEPGIITTPNDAFSELIDMHQSGTFERIHFNEWIPGLDVVAFASDLVVVMAQTGTGKTRALHNIPFNIRNLGNDGQALNYMMFDLELSRGILGLRYASMDTGKSTRQLLREIKQGSRPAMRNIDHIHLDNTGNIDLQYVKDRVNLVEDVTQKQIHVVAIDYIGLMKKKGFNSRYGALSEHVESFKGFLNETERTGLISTQCSRGSEKDEGYFKCPSMFDAKDSGSVENSAQLVLRMWRSDPCDRRRLSLNVGKWTHDEPTEQDFALMSDGLRIMNEQQYNEAHDIASEQDEMF